MSAKVLLDEPNRLHNLTPLQLLTLQDHRPTAIFLCEILPAPNLLLAILLQKPRRLRLRVLNNFMAADKIIEKIRVLFDSLFVIRHFALLEGGVVESAHFF